ncbi:uncharacterized protein ARMOST_02565 [Armillaria ostoyae]|uniref:Uncharacterized protein n=1 Tax=Armillaria ostoyae TaxID=47428 RepID=A0A284QS19_ARMOS|nr:uncharacterized protein ARMOST_02565 [Armillaria ostoyae]
MDYLLPHRRSSSCPPLGSTSAAPVILQEDEDVPVGPVFETRDDLQRRPSRVMMYYSSSSLYPCVDVPSVPMQVAEPEELSYSWLVDPRQFDLVTPSLLGDNGNGPYVASESEAKRKKCHVGEHDGTEISF